jgi:hypothetical protein
MKRERASVASETKAKSGSEAEMRTTIQPVTNGWTWREKRLLAAVANRLAPLEKELRRTGKPKLTKSERGILRAVAKTIRPTMNSDAAMNATVTEMATRLVALENAFDELKSRLAEIFQTIVREEQNNEHGTSTPDSSESEIPGESAEEASEFPGDYI